MIHTETDQLFTVEANRDFCWELKQPSHSISSILRIFQMQEPKVFWVMKKPRDASQIYKISCGAKNFILRAAKEQTAKALEIQCKIAACCNSFIKPISTRDGVYTFILDQLVWMAYPELKGEIYSGRNSNILSVIEASMKAEQSVRSVAASLDKIDLDDLPRLEYFFGDWEKDLETYLYGEVFDFRKCVSPFTLNLLKRNRNQISRIVAEASSSCPPKNLQVIYNDVHHANIVVGEHGQIGFLDIEDIVWGDESIGIGYGIFKLLRHLVFEKVHSVEEIQTVKVPEVINILRRYCPEVTSRSALAHFALIHIVSDIWEILDMAIARNNSAYLYDLEKKIHHIFEAQRIFLGEL